MSPDNADESNPVLEQIQAMIENPPKDISGVPDSFLDELERVPKKDLKKDDECAICRVPFLDGKTVRLRAPRLALSIQSRPIPARCGAALQFDPQIRPRLYKAMVEAQQHVSAGPKGPA